MKGLSAEKLHQSTDVAGAASLQAGLHSGLNVAGNIKATLQGTLKCVSGPKFLKNGAAFAATSIHPDSHMGADWCTALNASLGSKRPGNTAPESKPTCQRSQLISLRVRLVWPC